MLYTIVFHLFENIHCIYLLIVFIYYIFFCFFLFFFFSFLFVLSLLNLISLDILCIFFTFDLQLYVTYIELHSGISIHSSNIPTEHKNDIFLFVLNVLILSFLLFLLS